MSAKHAWTIKQYATGPSLRVQIRDEQTGQPVDLTGATAVAHLVHTDPDIGTIFAGHTVALEDAMNGILRLDWSAPDTDTAGTLLLEFEVTLTSGAVETYPQDDYVYLTIRPDLNGS